MLEITENCLNADVVVFIAVKPMNYEVKVMKPKVSVCSRESKAVSYKIM